MSETEKPFAPACERNQAIILEVLQRVLRPTDKNILEIGSGTGQHAVYIGEKLPDIIWQTSDVKNNHTGIRMWLEEMKLDNVRPPVEYEIGRSKWPVKNIDLVFSANTIHIISETLVKQLIQDLGQHLLLGNRVLFYGPFKYQGDFTSESNAEFDVWLKEQDPLSGIREFELIDDTLNTYGFELVEDIQMPAHNQFLVFEKFS